MELLERARRGERFGEPIGEPIHRHQSQNVFFTVRFLHSELGHKHPRLRRARFTPTETRALAALTKDHVATTRRAYDRDASLAGALHFFAWFQCPGFDSLHRFCDAFFLAELPSKIFHFTRTRHSRERLIAAMATLSLDPHLLVRLDSKSAPRARSFRERCRGALRCVWRRLCARCALVPALTMSTAAMRSNCSSARRRLAETNRQPFACGQTRRAAGGMRDPVRGSSAREREN